MLPGMDGLEVCRKIRAALELLPHDGGTDARVKGVAERAAGAVRLAAG
jgi:CheY-like chemotaxis protein